MSNWNNRANEIFLQAADIADAAERQQFVAEACGGDESLERCVSDLLKASDESTGFLERPFAHLPEGLRNASIELIPERVGRYKIVRELGEGGMGVVYLAQQETPVQRQVALKIIKPGLDTKQIISRFEAERQVLAMMEHPGIAKVYDAGATEAGRPYFVMELVSGIPITEFCERETLERPERLRLFVEVCSAVQHAHQKGIIHRDLKPSNILVTLQDGQPVVKVIDFGVAKAMGPGMAHETLTAAAQWIGTPLYMSPEQASATVMDVDTRSDVYSLGVVLYELLTGTTPFAAETLNRTDEFQKRQIICELDPPYPSARVSTLDTDGRAKLTGGERVDGRKLSRQLRGELDWIVMKALEKDRNRRYDSVSALAADLLHYLNDEPVSAGPPSQVYRLKKLAWRHRGALTTGLAILLALVVGTTVAIWQAFEATKARTLAEQRTQQTQFALKDATLARTLADQNRDRAVASELRVRQLLYTSEMRAASDAWQSNDVRRMREILARQVPAAGEADLRDFEWHFLARQSSVESQEILSVDTPLYCVRISPDGKVIATAGFEGRIHLFDGSSFEPIKSFDARQSELNALEFSPDGRSLYSAGDDGSVCQWELPSGRELRRIAAHQQAVFGLAIIPPRNAIVTGAKDHLLKVWDLTTGELRETLPYHTEIIQSVAASNRGLVGVGSDDQLVSGWTLEGRSPRWVQMNNPPARVNIVAFSAAGDLFAAGHVNGLLTIRDHLAGALVGQQAFSDAIHALAFSPAPRPSLESRWLAVGDRAGSVTLLPSSVFARQSGLLPPSSIERSKRWHAHTGRLYSMQFTANGSKLLTCGEDGKLKAWNYAASNDTRRLPFSVEHFVLTAPDRIATIGESIRITSLTNGKSLHTLPGSKSAGNWIRYAAEARKLFFSDPQYRVLAVGVNSKKPDVVYQPPANLHTGYFDVTPDGKRLAVALGTPGTPTDTGGTAVGIVFPLQAHIPMLPCASHPHQLRWAPDGTILFDQAKNLLFVRPETGEQVRVLQGHNSTIEDFEFSPDGELLGSISHDRSVRIWDWRSGKQIWEETAHEEEGWALTFSPDGETVATVTREGALRLWRWRQNTMVLDVQLMDWPVSQIAFSSDGLKLIVRADGVVRIYDASGGDRLDQADTASGD